MADHQLENDGSLEQLLPKIDELVGRLLREVQRPDWDHYFMDIAKVVSSRSNCIKRKVAAIIVRDKRVVSTGYNGTPRGTRNCNEGGCPRCNSMAVSGTNLDECLCSHGEENAIVQASLSRSFIERWRDLHHVCTVPDVRKDDHQLRNSRSDL